MLPYDVVAHILSIARLPIDTRIALRHDFPNIQPGKVHVHPHVARKIRQTVHRRKLLHTAPTGDLADCIMKYIDDTLICMDVKHDPGEGCVTCVFRRF